jgi:hypothetical protein
MATKSDFTEQEWEQLHKGVTGAGLLVSLSDRSFFDGFKEAGTLARHLADARKNSDSPLIRDLAEVRGSGFGLTDRPDDIERETLEALRSAVSVLEDKAPDELEAYRSFVLDVAESVAAAAGGGDEVEREAIEKIREALSATTTA